MLGTSDSQITFYFTDYEPQKICYKVGQVWQKHHHAMHVYSQINLKYLQFSTENKCISDTSVWTQTYIHTWKGKSRYPSYLFFSYFSLICVPHHERESMHETV